MSGVVLLIGASGQVGTAVARLLPNVETPGRREFDLGVATRESADRLVHSLEPSVVINCAAYTAVDRAEEEYELARAVNGTAVGVLAETTAEARIPFVTFSTDYVFNGRSRDPYLESSPTDPVNAYGRTKLIGEQLALDANPRALIIRTSWVISSTHTNFVATMLRATSAGRRLNVVDDQEGCPTVAGDLAVGCLEAVLRGASGVLHMTNTGSTTWFGLARAAVELAGLSPDLISPCRTEDYPTPAKRPAYSVLGSERLQELGLSPLPTWQQSLPELVRELNAARASENRGCIP
jgi:dTDP-4-dehydrorhamnose reductase